MTNPIDQPTPVAQPSEPSTANPATATAADRIYPTDPTQTLRLVHDVLSTGATFTLDSEDAASGTITFHDYEDARFILHLTAALGGGTEARLHTEGDHTGKRAAEFYANLDSAATRSAAPGTGSRAAHAPIVGTAVTPSKETHRSSKTVKLAIIMAVLFLLCTFTGPSWGMLALLTVLPALLSGYSVYITRKSDQQKERILALVAVGITVVALIVGGVGAVRTGLKHQADEKAYQESLKVTCKEYTWPSSDLVAQLPQPQSGTGEIKSESSNAFSISVCDTDVSQYEAYVKSVQEKGFTIDYYKSDTSFSGKNDAGYSVQVMVNDHNTNVMDIFIYPPDGKSSNATEQQSDGKTDTDSNSTNQSDNNQAGNDQSDTNQSTNTNTDSTQSGTSESDFKTAMDSYESFMNEYVDFMTKYDSEDKPLSMAADYAKMLVKYNDAMKKFDAIDESTLTPEEQQYYIEVQTRVNEKLASIQ